MKKVFIIAAIVLVIAYFGWCCYSILSQEDVNFICKKDVQNVVDNDINYFQSIAEFYESYENRTIFYDLAVHDFSEELTVPSLEPSEADFVEKIFKKYGFNTLYKIDDNLMIFYNRPTKHNIVIGIQYDYITQKWDYLYSHSYERCSCGHFNGYRVFDFLFNRL